MENNVKPPPNYERMRPEDWDAFFNYSINPDGSIASEDDEIKSSNEFIGSVIDKVETAMTDEVNTFEKEFEESLAPQFDPPNCTSIGFSKFVTIYRDNVNNKCIPECLFVQVGCQYKIYYGPQISHIISKPDRTGYKIN